MLRNPSLQVLLLAAGLLAAAAAFAEPGAAPLASPAPPPLATGGLGTSELIAATLRMAAGLGVVLGLLALAAWASRRFRLTGRLRSGLIEVVSGISLGAREKVVLLRVGQEQVLVGVSPAGMRTLHVLRNPDSATFPAVMQAEAAEVRP